MQRLPGLLLLIAIASVLVSGYSRPVHTDVSRHSHGHVFDVFGFETREQVAALGASAAGVSLQPAADPAS